MEIHSRARRVHESRRPSCRQCLDLQTSRLAQARKPGSAGHKSFSRAFVGVAGRVGAHLGADFSAVRVHQDPLAQEASQAMGARAFASGGDVFLGPGESGGDLGLLAHALTHVAQQGVAGQRAPQLQVLVVVSESRAER